MTMFSAISSDVSSLISGLLPWTLEPAPASGALASIDSDVLKSSESSEVVNFVTPSLSGFWANNRDLHSFLVMSFPSFTSTSSGCPVFPVAAADAEAFDPGFYNISSRGIRSYNKDSVSWEPEIDFDSEDLIDLPDFPYPNLYFRLL